MKKIVLLALLTIIILAGVNAQYFVGSSGFGVGIRNHNVSFDVANISGLDQMSLYYSGVTFQYNGYAGEMIGFYSRAEIGILTSILPYTNDEAGTEADLSTADMSFIFDALLGVGFKPVETESFSLMVGIGPQIMADIYVESLYSYMHYTVGVGADIVANLKFSKSFGLYAAGGFGYGFLPIMEDFTIVAPDLQSVTSWGVGLGLRFFL